MAMPQETVVQVRTAKGTVSRVTRVYRIVAKNFPEDLTSRVSAAHAFALASSKKKEMSEQPDTPQDASGDPQAAGVPESIVEKEVIVCQI
jgi:hypothetical protein